MSLATSRKLYVLGGSPCSGKSTLAERLCGNFPLALYSADAHEAKLLTRCTAARQPIMTHYRALTWPQIMAIPLEQAVRDEWQYYRERFELILEDLNSLVGDGPLLLEGADFLPELVHTLPVLPARVFYLIPSAEFQYAHYWQRPWVRSLLAQCPDPEAAFAHWMARDQLFAAGVAAQARQFGYPCQIVTERLSLAYLEELVRTHFLLLDE